MYLCMFRLMLATYDLAELGIAPCAFCRRVKWLYDPTSHAQVSTRTEVEPHITSEALRLRTAKELA